MVATLHNFYELVNGKEGGGREGNELQHYTLLAVAWEH